MEVVVQKYGGSSLATLEAISQVAARIAAHRSDVGHMVVVVSAMGDTTDELLALAHAVNPCPPVRDLDLLLATGEIKSAALLTLALHALGVPARALTGAQAGIITCDTHGAARVVSVDPGGILAALTSGDVAVVAGFQGTSRRGAFTTLGRGGSDTTAVAVAAALGARACDICTDVDGVYTADPRRDPSARLLPSLTYNEMLALVDAGAVVVHREAVALARDAGIVLHVRSASATRPGSVIGPAGVPYVVVGASGPMWDGVDTSTAGGG